MILIQNLTKLLYIFLSQFNPRQTVLCVTSGNVFIQLRQFATQLGHGLLLIDEMNLEPNPTFNRDLFAFTSAFGSIQLVKLHSLYKNLTKDKVSSMLLTFEEENQENFFSLRPTGRVELFV